MNNTKNYLKEKQHIVFQVLKNSFKREKTSHAYIISGSKGSPILDTAIFMAQSLVCLNKDENNLACEECINCQKIKNNACYHNICSSNRLSSFARPLSFKYASAAFAAEVKELFFQ